MSRVLLVVLSLLASTANAQTLSYFRAPRGVPRNVAAGPDGNVWFAQNASYFWPNQVDGLTRVTPLGEMTSYPSPHVPRHRGAITPWPAGAMSFVWDGGIDSLDIAGGTYKSYPLPFHAADIFGGPDGNLWFGYPGGVGRLTPAGEVSLFPLDSIPGTQATAAGLTIGPDGNLWFADPAHGYGVMDWSGHVLKRGDGSFYGEGMATASDGTVWLMNLEQLARIKPDGSIERVSLPLLQGHAMLLQSVSPGPNGTVWFAATQATIGVASPSGEVRLFSLDFPYVTDVVLGSDGNMWASREVTVDCLSPCYVDPGLPPIALVRVNLVNPTPRITSVARAFDGVVVRGLGFVPDTVVRFNGVDRATTYLSPFEVLLDAPDTARGGTFVAVNKAPGGGASAAFEFASASIVRRRAAR